MGRWVGRLVGSGWVGRQVRQMCGWVDGLSVRSRTAKGVGRGLGQPLCRRRLLGSLLVVLYLKSECSPQRKWASPCVNGNDPIHITREGILVLLRPQNGEE